VNWPPRADEVSHPPGAAGQIGHEGLPGSPHATVAGSAFGRPITSEEWIGIVVYPVEPAAQVVESGDSAPCGSIVLACIMG